MIERKPQNIVIFSAGQLKRGEELIDNPHLKILSSYFPKADIICHEWRDLFSNSRDKKNKALLPHLIKKIPTFDFAIILADDVDEARLRGKDGVRIMRDNVLFECGLCIMALGTERVILLIEEGVRIIDDLWGIGGEGEPAICVVTYRPAKKLGEGDNGNFEEQLEKVADHIYTMANTISPVVIGAAVSTADGYFTNFVLRFWDNIENGFTSSEHVEPWIPSLKTISLEIHIPKKIGQNFRESIDTYYKDNGFIPGKIPSANFRGLEFRYKNENGKIIVCDVPSTISASYSTVKDILDLDADEEKSATAATAIDDAEKRFLAKEADSFKFTLKKLMEKKVLTQKLKTDSPYRDDAVKIKNTVKRMEQVEIKIVDIPKPD